MKSICEEYMREEESFELGIKPAFLTGTGNKWVRENMHKYYYDYIKINKKYSRVILFHREEDRDYYRNNNLTGSEMGRLLGYPPIACNNWGKLSEVPKEDKNIVHYKGISFMCKKEDVEEALKWMRENIGKEDRDNG